MMKEKISTQTPQETFWAGEFGDEYINRNNSEQLVESNLDFFKKSLRACEKFKSVLELGCNIGLNLKALSFLMPETRLTGVDVNLKAVKIAQSQLAADINQGTISEPLSFTNKFDLVFSKTVLIHIHPDHLSEVYKNMFSLSARYILVAEYYSPTPTEVIYRGHSERLFKRDFAGELMTQYPLKLIDYGFVYRRDPKSPQDDINWFLLEK